MTVVNIFTFTTQASEAALHVERANASVEEARSILERARAFQTDAKTQFDELLQRAEDAGFPKRKIRQIGEDSLQSLIAQGLVEVLPFPLFDQDKSERVEEAVQPVKPKQTRQRKTNTNDALVENSTDNVLQEPSVETVKSSSDIDNNQQNTSVEILISKSENQVLKDDNLVVGHVVDENQDENQDENLERYVIRVKSGFTMSEGGLESLINNFDGTVLSDSVNGCFVVEISQTNAKQLAAANASIIVELEQIFNTQNKNSTHVDLVDQVDNDQTSDLEEDKSDTLVNNSLENSTSEDSDNDVTNKTSQENQQEDVKQPVIQKPASPINATRPPPPAFLRRSPAFNK